MAERSYPVRSEATARKMQAAYAAKIERNRASGRESLSKGEYTPFTGHSREALGKIFEVSLGLDESSRREIQERVIRPLTELAKKHGVVLATPGQGDVPSHITLEVGVFQQASEERSREAETWLVSNRSHMRWLINILRGLSFHLDTLVSSPAIYICASKFDAEQGAPFRIRQLVDTMMERSMEKTGEADQAGVLAPRKYDDILHSVVARIANRPPSAELLEFIDEAERLVGAGLKERPIKVVIDEVSVGRALDRVERIDPKLLV